MTSFMCDFKMGDLYKSFEVLNVFDVPDYHSVAIHLRHTKTNLEVFHLQNDDPENLFAFAFRTPNEKSTGLAHIIEHSVLCGSQRYPLKDPFVVLSNQSVKTYLNAMTFPDKTVYPASSIAKTDYFNLMSVYGDAVFFPKLDREIFMQEAHRFEVDDDGSVSIQGVVYNEMKGSYSSFDGVAADAAIASLHKGTIYEKDSGGDPLEIPNVTYEDFLEFHRKWYRPDNCFVFLNGNIPTKEQLDFIQDNFLNRLEEKFQNSADKKSSEKRIDDFLRLVTPKKMEKPVEVYVEGPSGDGETNNTVLVNWLLGRTEDALSATEKTVLTGILCNHDGSPLQKALLESGLGEDIAPQTGLFSSIYSATLTVGLRGVKSGNEKKVEELLLETVRNLVENGISKKDIEATISTLEFSHREIKRGHGPFALSLMARPIYGWLYGDGIENQIKLRSHLNEIKRRIKDDGNYLTGLLRMLLLENKNRSLVVVKPSKAYSEKRERAEKERIESYLRHSSVDAIRAENKNLHVYQQKTDDKSFLPHLNPSDFITDGKPLMNPSNSEISFVPGVDSSQVPFVKNVDNTNGIIYFDVAFPADVVDVKDYPLLPAFADCVTECGWGDLDWAKSAEACALYTGGISVNLLTMEGPSTERAKDLSKKYNWINRDWVVFRVSMLEEKAEQAMMLFQDCLTKTNFEDEKRIQDILKESKNDFESSVIPDGHIYTSNRVWCKKSRKNAVDEIWNGLTQYFALKKIADTPVAQVSLKFKSLFELIKAGGAVIHGTAESSGFSILEKILPDFINAVKISAPKAPFECDDSQFYALTDLEESDNPDCGAEAFLVSAQVGYAAECIPASRYEDENSFAEEVCSHWLSNNLLWEKIRTIGGSYGAFCNAEPMSGTMIFSSYRDPSPFDSCQVFERCLAEAASMDFSEDEVVCAIMGCYSHFIQPQSPKGRGSASLTRLLYGIVDEDREKKILGILKVTPQSLKAAFQRLEKFSLDNDFKKKSIICGKKMLPDEGFAGKIITLPL